MKHVCIRDFQRNFYNHVNQLQEPLAVTKYGQVAFTVMPTYPVLDVTTTNSGFASFNLDTNHEKEGVTH